MVLSTCITGRYLSALALFQPLYGGCMEGSQEGAGSVEMLFHHICCHPTFAMAPGTNSCILRANT